MIKNVACLQMDIKLGDVSKNIEHVKEMFNKLHDNIDTVVLPEFWPMGYSLDTLADVVKHDLMTPLQSLAKQYDVDIIAGSIPTERNGEFFNTLPVISRNGELVFSYDKAHLFRLMDEEKFLSEGNERGVFTLDGIKSAAVICYDIRFPEWIKTHMLADVDILYIVAEWPDKRLDHWRALLIARAIENQVYVVACNRVGSDLHNTFAGHSMMIDPWGNVVAEAGKKEEVLSAELDLELIRQIRREIPIYEDRRPDLYRFE